MFIKLYFLLLVLFEVVLGPLELVEFGENFELAFVAFAFD